MDPRLAVARFGENVAVASMIDNIPKPGSGVKRIMLTGMDWPRFLQHGDYFPWSVAQSWSVTDRINDLREQELWKMIQMVPWAVSES